MTWFQNLNATPRLMISFGLLILVSLGMGYLGVSSLAKSNLGSQLMYQEDMLGSIRADQIDIDRLDIAKQGRDAVLNAANAAVVDEDQKQVAAALPNPGSLFTIRRRLSSSTSSIKYFPVMKTCRSTPSSRSKK